MKVNTFIFIYIISIIAYIIVGTYLLRKTLKDGMEYTLSEFIGSYIILPILPFWNTCIVVLLISLYLTSLFNNDEISKKLNNSLKRIFKIEGK